MAGLRGIHAENTVLINAVGNNGKCSATHVNSRVLCFVLMLFVLFCLGATNLRFYGELGRVPPLCLSFTVWDWQLCMALYSSSQSSFPHQNGIGHLTGRKGGES